MVAEQGEEEEEEETGSKRGGGSWMVQGSQTGLLGSGR